MVLRYKEQLGAAMRARREELGMTQKAVAEAAHVKEPQTVSRWERGETMPSDLEAVAEALKTTIPKLMAGIPTPIRVARKFDIDPESSQLDRVEQAVSQLSNQVRLLQAETAARDAEVLRRIDEGLPPTHQTQHPPQ